MAELLLSKGYVVHGIKRRSSSFNTARVDHLYVDPHQTDTRFCMHYGDMTDATNLIRIMQETQPDEIYNLAAQSHVQVSFETPEYTANADALGTLRLLEAIRILKMEGRVRFYQASTSELFGDAPPPQNESTPFPRAVRTGVQSLRLLDHRQLPRGVRHARVERHPLQSRRSDARRNVCDAEDHPRRGRNRGGPAGDRLSRQPRRAPRLGTRPRFRRRHVADPPAGPARRLRAGDGRIAFGPRVRRSRRLPTSA